jgi:hypothetical protein
MGLSYMKCGKVECEKSRVIGEGFCAEHLAHPAVSGEAALIAKIEELCDCEGKRLNGRARELANEIREICMPMLESIAAKARGANISMTNALADSLSDMLALFDDEGTLREDFQDQISVAIEKAEANMKDFLAIRALQP